MYRCNEFREKRELVLRKSNHSGHAHKGKGHFAMDCNKHYGSRGSPADFNRRSFSPLTPRPTALLPSLLSTEIEPPPQQKQYKVIIPPVVPITMYSGHPMGYFDAGNGRDASHFGPSNARTSPNTKKVRSDSYKTVMCQSWLENNSCHFGENCRFAHGEKELRPIKLEQKQNGKYKTKLCDKYTTTGVCPYGARCLFIHPETEGAVEGNDYIRADKMVEIASRHAAAKKQRLTEALLQAPLFMTDFNGLPGHRFAVDSSTHRFKDEDNERLALARALQPHPSWPLEPKTYKNAVEPMPLKDRHNSLSDILVNLEQMVMQQPDTSAPLNITRRTPSPVPSELNTKGTATPASGYVTGESSPAIGSFLGEFKPFHPVGISPFSIMGISSDSHYSSSGSISGEDVDGQDMNIDLNFDFLKDSSFNVDEKPMKDEVKQEIAYNGQITYDPFAYSFMGDNYSREWCKDKDRIW